MLHSWVGGTGTPPDTHVGEFMANGGWTSDAASATNFRGHDGQDGANGQDGRDGRDGEDGFSPMITVEIDTDDTYMLRITNRDGFFFTPNLRGGTTPFIGNPLVTTEGYRLVTTEGFVLTAINE
jgi:hypothetical protein